MILRKELEAMAAPFRDIPKNEFTSDGERNPRRSESEKTNKRPSSLKSDEVLLRRDHQKEINFMRPGTVEEEPDSMDSIISDPSSFPITIVPSPSSTGGGLLIRNSTIQSSISKLSRISTSSK